MFRSLSIFQSCPVARAAVLSLVFANCGRIGFEPSEATVSDAGGDDRDGSDLRPDAAETADRYVTDFDSSDDWIITGAPLWECGNQTDDAFGPPSGHSGTTVCGTRLNANYGLNSATANLTSPVLSLSEMQSPVLSFWMDMEAEENSCGGDFVCDGGHIELAINGDPFVPLSFADTGRAGLLPNGFAIGPGGPAGWHEIQPQGDWGEVKLDLFHLETFGLTGLSEIDTLQLRFVFTTDSALGDFPGWYIDDVRLYDFEQPDPYSLPYSEDFEAPSEWEERGGGDVWAIGQHTDPAFGPAGAVSGTGVAGTGLNATYDLSPTSTRHIRAFLIGPEVTLAGSTAPQLRFWMDMESNGGDGGHLGLSINGDPFVSLSFTETALTLPYNSSGTLGATDWPTSSGWSGVVPTVDWQQVQVDIFELTTPGLTNIRPEDTIRVRFGFIAGRNNSSLGGWYIDDVSITDL